MPPEPETAGTEKEELRVSTEEVFLSKRKGPMSLPYTKTRLWMLPNGHTVKQRVWSSTLCTGFLAHRAPAGQQPTL